MVVRNGTIGNDSLVGTNDDDLISGYGGNDTLRGLDGEDEIYGGSGADEIYGGAGLDTIYGGDGNDLIVDGGGVSGSGSRNILYGGAGNDTIRMEGTYNYAYGGDGDDRFELIGGSSVPFTLVEGGAGADTFVMTGGEIGYASSPAAVSINLATGAVSGGDAQGDILIGVRSARGSGFGDTLIGNEFTNFLRGEGGWRVAQRTGGDRASAQKQLLLSKAQESIGMCHQHPP